MSNDLFGRKLGSLPDQKYSEELIAFGQDKVWDEATSNDLPPRPAAGGGGHQDGILRPPKKDEEIKAVLAYVATFDGMAPE